MPSFTPSVQASAGRYLLFGLPAAASAASEPTVTRTYYNTCKAAKGATSRWALVLRNGTKPQPIYTVFRQR